MTKARILVVEDEGSTALYIKHGLEGLGYTVTGLAATGEQAIKLVGEENPDLVLMDVRLKGDMDGINVAEHIRNHLDIPVVFLTGYVDEQTLERAKITDPFGYILKPFEERELGTHVEMALYKHQMELKLREREEYFRTLIENASDILSILDENGTIRFASPSIERILGYDLQELIGKNVFGFIHPEDEPTIREKFFRAITHDKNIVTSAQYRFRHKDGTWRILESLGSNRLNDPVVAGMVITSRDITKRVRAEQALSEREEQYHSLFDTSPDAITLTDLDLSILVCNQQALALFGYEDETEILGKSALDFIAPEEHWRVMENVRKTLEVGEARNIEYMMVRKDGERFLGELNASLIVDSEGKPKSFIGIARDISDRKRAEENLRHSVAELARSNAFIAALGQVAARIETTSNLDQVMVTLGGELEKMKISCAVILLDPDSQESIFYYTSVKPSILELFQTYTGVELLGYHLPSGTIVYNVKPQHSRFFPDLLPNFASILPNIPRTVIARAVRYAGVTPFTPLICLPLMVRERVVGSLSVWGSSLREEDIPAFTVFANQVAVAIDKARLLEAVQRRATEAETLRQAATVVTSALDLDQVLDRIFTQLETVIPYDSASILLIEEDRLHIMEARGFPNPSQIIGQTFPIDDELLQTTRETGTPLILRDAQADSRFKGWGGTKHVRGWMGVPLIVHGETIGYLTFDSHQIAAYNQDHAMLAQAFANQAAIAIENARLFKEVQHLAITDPLTGLYNRRHFFDIASLECERSRRYGSQLSIVILDIDRFKDVNDTYGHLVGDQVLRVVAERFRNEIREIDLLSRYGGEEFVIMMPQTRLEDAFRAAERIRQKIFGKPVEYEGNSIKITVSLGVAELNDHCPNLDELLKCADRALYIAKQAGRNQSATWRD